MAKWGIYPPDEQLRLKRAAAEDLYEAGEDLLAQFDQVWDAFGVSRSASATADIAKMHAALAKARGEAA